jgi:pimeloyl-ACP methyl ester carboxylesterase
MRRSFRVRLTASAVLVILAIFPITSKAADTAPTIAVEEFMIDAIDPGTKLYVRNKHPESMQRFSPDRTLLYVHGATQPSEATFDLSLDGLSWMDYIAQHGWDVYLVDVRGYGRSTRPPEMEQPPAANPPIAGTDVAVKDVGAAVDFILKRRGMAKVSLMGWSWGCSIMGAYTATHNDKVASLVLYAPGWLLPSSQNPGPPVGAYNVSQMAKARNSIQSGAPESRKDDLLPTASFEAWSAAVLASDPASAQHDPPAYRSPAGVSLDTRDYWRAGRPFYDPSNIEVPTLVVVAEWDQVNPDDGALALFHKLPNSPHKRFVELGEGTHMILLEKNRLQLFRAVQAFLDQAELHKS